MSALVMFDCAGGDFLCHVVSEQVWNAIVVWDGEPTDADGWYAHVSKVTEEAQAGEYGENACRTFGLQAGVPDHVRMGVRHLLMMVP